MSLSSIQIGQEKVKKLLISFLTKGRVPFTLIFSGPIGSGKSYFAHHFSEDIICPEKDGIFACRRCTSCKQIESGVNLDYYILKNEEYESIKIEDIRKLQEFVAFKPIYGDKKVCLIEDAHLLTIEAFNSFLKTLEEPNIYTVLILTTSKIDFIPKTVKSRAVIISFLPYSEYEAKEILIKNGINEDSASLLAKISKGNIKKAFNLTNQEFYEQRKNDIHSLLNFLNEDSSIPFLKDKNETLRSIENWQSFLEDSILTRLSKNTEQIVNTDFANEIISITSQLNIEDLFQILKTLINSEEDISRTNVNVRNYMNSLFFELKRNILKNKSLPDEY